MTTYPILPIQIDPADIAACTMDLILLRADDPSARMPASAIELLTMEFEGWEWDFATGRYERINPDQRYTLTQKAIPVIGRIDTDTGAVTMPRYLWQHVPHYFFYQGNEYRQESDGRQYRMMLNDMGERWLQTVAERITNQMINDDITAAFVEKNK